MLRNTKDVRRAQKVLTGWLGNTQLTSGQRAHLMGMQTALAWVIREQAGKPLDLLAKGGTLTAGGWHQDKHLRVLGVQ